MHKEDYFVDVDLHDLLSSLPIFDLIKTVSPIFASINHEKYNYFVTGLEVRA